MRRNHSRTFLMYALATYGLAGSVNAVDAQPRAEEFRPQKLLDPLPPITEFPVKQVKEVGDALNPSELVIGVTIGNESRAYPVNMLTGPRREILNDKLGGKAIAVMWCHLCHYGIVFAADVGKRKLTFGVSGMLWNRSLVMYDKETGTLWSLILGEAMQGKLKGEKLEQVPCMMTDWKTWSREHPDGTVVMLSRSSTEYKTDFYKRPEQFVLGIANSAKVKSWRLDALAKATVVNDTCREKPVVVLFDKESMTARLYSRTVGNKELTFESGENGIRDMETGSTWEPTTGRATAGPLKGEHLTPLNGILSYRDVWTKFHPKSETYPVDKK